MFLTLYNLLVLTCARITYNYPDNIIILGPSHFNRAEDYWSPALTAGVKAMTFYGGASTGMRTMLDALIPAIDELNQGKI